MKLHIITQIDFEVCLSEERFIIFEVVTKRISEFKKWESKKCYFCDEVIFECLRMESRQS